MLDVDAKLHITSNGKQRDFMRVRHVEAHSRVSGQRRLAISTVSKPEVFRLLVKISPNDITQKPTAHQKVPAMFFKMKTTGPTQLVGLQGQSKSVPDHVRLLER